MVANICTEQGCDSPVRARKLCGKHYQRLRNKVGLTPMPTREESFWQKVDKNGPEPIGTPATGACWMWTAGEDGYGYGTFWDGKVKVKAYAYSYCLENEKPEKGMHIDHICHQKLCVRPSHLRAITHQQNIQNRTALPSNNKSGYRGVFYIPHVKKWRAQVESMGVRYRFGDYATPEEANKAVVEGRMQIHTHNDLDRINYRKDAA